MTEKENLIRAATFPPPPPEWIPVTFHINNASYLTYNQNFLFDEMEQHKRLFPTKKNYSIDEENIFLLGLSGGGQMSLLCGAKHLKLFKAIGAFVPVCDLERWAQENLGYTSQIYDCCNNDKEEMKKRCPNAYVNELAETNLKIFHGKFDSVVSYLQSYDLYNKIIGVNPTARVFLDIFDGGHEMNMDVAFDWFLSQYKKESLTAVTG